jgi:MFS family permease
MTDLSTPETYGNKAGGLSILIFTSIGHFMNDGFTFIFPVVADALAALDGYPASYLTILFAAFYTASTVFSLAAGRYSDKGSVLGRIHTGIILISTGIAGFSLTVTYSGLPYSIAVISAVVMGMGTGFYHPIGASLIQRSYAKNKLGRVLGINGSMGSVGRAVFPSVFLVLAYFVTQGYSLAFLALAGIIVSIIIWLGLRNTIASRPTEAAKSGLRGAANWSIILLTLVFFIKSVSSQGMVAWIPTFLTYNKGLGVGITLGVVMTVMYTSAIIGQPLFGILVDRVDKRLLLMISSLGTAATMFAYMNTSGWFEMLMLSLFGFFTFSGFPLTMSLVSDYAPKGNSSLTNSIVWGLGNSGGTVLGPIIAGTIILNNYSAIPLSFDVMIVLSVIVSFFALALPRSGRRTRMPMF